MGSETLSKVLIMPELNHQHTNKCFIPHTQGRLSHTVFMSLPARMAAHILISTPFMPHTYEAIQKQTNTKGTHSTHRGLYGPHVSNIRKSFSLSLVKQSRESIRISRGFEKKKTQLEASQDVLDENTHTTPASTTLFSHLIHWLAHQTCYMKQPAGTF